MRHAEIIFESGAKSVVSFEDEEEVRTFVREHQRRALAGEPGAAQDQAERDDVSSSDFTNFPSLDTMKSRPAERVYKVYLYSDHPGNLHPTNVSVETVRELVNGMASEDNTIDPNQLISALRDETSPVYPVTQGVHESIYKAEADGELDLSFLNETPPASEEGAA